jgi:hypothetical protein
MFSYDCMRILLMMLDCAVVHSTATWVSNSLKGHPFVCNLGLQSFKGTYLATVLQSWFIGVRFFKAEICPGSHSLRGYQWSLKDSGARVRTRIARGMLVRLNIPKMAISQVRDILIQHFFLCWTIVWCVFCWWSGMGWKWLTHVEMMFQTVEIPWVAFRDHHSHHHLACFYWPNHLAAGGHGMPCPFS